MNIDPRIRHLNIDQINSLINRYYANENVNNLIREFKINVIPSNLFRLFPPIELEEICPYCDEFLIAKYPSKSSYDGSLSQGVCPKCKHSNSNQCNCPNCSAIYEKKKILEIQRKKDEIKQLLSLNQYTPIDFHELSFEQKIYLGAIIRDGMNEDFKMIKPINSFLPKFSPDSTFTLNILRFLYNESGLIVIHPDSDPNFFIDIDFDNNSFRYDPYRVCWSLNIYSEDFSLIELCNQLMNPSTLNQSNSEIAFELWNKIALYECIEYLKYSIEAIFNSGYDIGEKTILTFKDLLKEFSVSQIYGIIYKATNNALRFKEERKVNKKYAVNTIIGNCRSYGERALSNGWEISKYHRIKPNPQSSLSKFIYERVLQVGDNGFYHKPYKDIIKTQTNQNFNEEKE